MNSKGLKTLSSEDRINGMLLEGKILSGVVDEALFSEEFSTMHFEELTRLLTSRDSVAASDLGNASNRMKLNYILAILRDAEYSHASRRYIQALGENDVFRLLYEGGKLHFDASK